MHIKLSDILVLTYALIRGCGTEKHKKLYRIAEVEFRKSIFEPDKLSTLQMDSFDKADPDLVSTLDSTEQIGLRLLFKNGYVVNDKFIFKTLKKITNKDQVFIEGSRGIDAFFLQLDASKLKARIHVRGPNIADSIEVPFPMEEYGLFLIKDSLTQKIVFFNQFHISNGDNFDFLFYGVK